MDKKCSEKPYFLAMIREGNHLEFEIFGSVDGLIHGVYLRDADPTCSFAIASCDQVHGVGVMFAQKGNVYTGCDGLITDQKELALVIRHADCQVAFIVDPQKQVIGLVHAGWRGQVQNIYGKSIEMMVKQFKSRPEELLVGVSPSLGPKHAQFVNYKEEWPQQFWKYRVDETHFNLWDLARAQFVEAGVPAEHIEIAMIDTYEREKEFFSYRRDKTSKRNKSMLAFKP